ncbi:unnamed protein product [Adineta steineri]|nr:unnamed protein product [Adineta steineri]
MSNFEEKLNILKKKKLTAKTIVEQQRNEIRLLKSSMTINERLEEIYKRFDDKNNIDNNLYKKILQLSNNKNEIFSLNDQIHQTIENLSKLIQQILNIFSLKHNHNHFKNQDLNIILKEQKECFQLIKWKLSDMYANRIADEIKMNIDKRDKISFEDLNLPSGLVLGLYSMGFQNGPSDTQALILPYSLSEEFQRNIIVQSKTGTGKTISYIIHTLACIQSGLSQPQALIIVPTIELALTVGSGIEKMSKYLPNTQTTYVTSSLSIQQSFTTPIIIVTIDMFDLLQSVIDFSQLKILILDEIDTMIIREDYRHNLLHLFHNLPLMDDCQILVYSSTLSEQIMNFTNQLIPNSIVIKQKSDKQQLGNVEQYYIMCQDENKKNDIVNIILKQFLTTQIMIFCSNDDITERLYEKIIIHNKNNVRMLTTKCDNHQRVSLIEEFRSNFYRIFLLSAETSATTHGIDLDNVNIVINYDLPRSLGINSDLDYVTYHQRLDRCGRYNKHGYLFNLIQSLDDWNIQLGQQNYFSFVIKPIDIDGIQSLVL